MLKPQKVGMVPDRDPDHHTLVGPQMDDIAHAAALAVEIGRQEKISGKTRVRKTGDGWRGSEIESNQQTLALRFAQEQQEISARFPRSKPAIAPARKRRARPAQADQLAVQIVDRRRVGALMRDVHVLEILPERQPWLGLGESGMPAVIPLHRGAAAVASYGVPPMSTATPHRCQRRTS